MNREEFILILEGIEIANTIAGIGLLFGLGATDQEINAILTRIQTEAPPGPLTSDKPTAVLDRFRDLLREQREGR